MRADDRWKQLRPRSIASANRLVFRRASTLRLLSMVIGKGTSRREERAGECNTRAVISEHIVLPLEERSRAGSKVSRYAFSAP